LGRVYTREELEAVRDWATERKVHVVFDEIYGLSVHGHVPFTSVASLGPLGEFTHIVWAFSKDFGASGLRCGVLISENNSIIASVGALAYWGTVSGDTQARLGDMVADRPWVADFVAENKRRLRHAYAEVAAALREEGIPHLTPGAGFFALCDLRDFLSEPTFGAEEALWNELLNEKRVNLTPGSACRIEEPGFFRLCFASQPTQAVVTGIRRIGALLRER
jgi:aspartate/methionine/tyrosine aminotransferase